MGYITILKCDECSSYSDFQRPLGENFDIPYSEILEGSDPYTFEFNDWLFIASLCEEDPIAICFDHYCPQCKDKEDR